MGSKISLRGLKEVYRDDKDVYFSVSLTNGQRKFYKAKLGKPTGRIINKKPIKTYDFIKILLRKLKEVGR